MKSRLKASLNRGLYKSNEDIRTTHRYSMGDRTNPAAPLRSSRRMSVYHILYSLCTLCLYPLPAPLCLLGNDYSPTILLVGALLKTTDQKGTSKHAAAYTLIIRQPTDCDDHHTGLLGMHTLMHKHQSSREQLLHYVHETASEIYLPPCQQRQARQTL